MRIDSIELKNFLSHSDTKIKFEGNINAIIGPNGAGKSAIIDGIIFSLFRENNRGNRIEDLIKKGKREATLELSLELSNSRLIIKRNISTSSSASSNDLLIEVTQQAAKTVVRGAREVNNKILDYIKIPKDVLLHTIIIPQGKIEEIIDNLPDIMKKVLKLDKLEKLVDSRGPIKDLIKQLQSKYQLIEVYKNEYDKEKKRREEFRKKEEELVKEESEIIKELEEKKKEFNILNEIIKELEEKYKEYIKLNSRYIYLINEINKREKREKELEKEVTGIEYLEKLEEKLEEYKIKKQFLEELKRKKRKIEEYEGRIKELKRKIEEYRNKLNEKENLRKYYEEYLEKSKILENLRKYYEEYLLLNNSLKNLENELRNLREEIGKIEISENIDKLENELRNLREEIGKIERLIGEKNGRKRELEKIKSNLSTLKGNKCPVCGRDLEIEHKNKIISEITQELNNISNEISQLNSKRNLINNIINNLE
ncbi:MAG: AAA family ATPase, partial [Sulfolobales archaeon]